MAKSKAIETREGTPVMVTTQYRGVYFGYVEGEFADLAGQVDGAILLRHMRNCVWWDAELHGLGGLATRGPNVASKIGPAAPRGIVNQITGIWAVTPEAALAWESEPWGR